MKNWLMFIGCGLIWGSSFLLIKMGVQELTPLQLVTGRIGLCAVAFVVALAALRKRIPSDRQTIILMTVVGILNTAAPFVLITWAEQLIDSGLAGVLNATVPLFSIVIAHVALHDDKIYGGKLAGLLTGFVGIVLLATRSFNPMHPNPIEGQIAMLVAAACYATSAVIIRRSLRHIEPIVTAGVSMVIGALAVAVITLLFERPLPDIGAISPQTKLIVVVLAILNTFITNTMYFALLNNWGASRATMVTYLVPPISVMLGVIVEHEPLDIRLIIGAALIIGGVALVNFRRPSPKPTNVTDPSAGQAVV